MKETYQWYILNKEKLYINNIKLIEHVKSLLLLLLQISLTIIYVYILFIFLIKHTDNFVNPNQIAEQIYEMLNDSQKLIESGNNGGFVKLCSKYSYIN